MRKTEANKVKVGDTLYVLRKHWYFLGKGVAVKFVKVVEVISKDAEGNLPLFKVEFSGKVQSSYSYKFFEAIYHEGDSRCDKCHKIGSFVDGTLYGKPSEPLVCLDGASFGRYDALCNSCLNEINN